MIHNLFDEYRFFARYPDRELHITAALFGSLIKHGLVSSITLGMALRYVLDALRKPPGNKMFIFGLEVRHRVGGPVVMWRRGTGGRLLLRWGGTGVFTPVGAALALDKE